MTAHDPTAPDAPRVLKAGCAVRVDGRIGRCGLFQDEHQLVEGEWIHPVGLNRKGYWTWDEADAIDERTTA